MSRLFDFLLPDLQVGAGSMTAMPPKVTSLDIDVMSPLAYPGYPLRPALSYQDVMRCSGMSWSKMLQETSKTDFREFSRESQRVLSRSQQQLYTNYPENVPQPSISDSLPSTHKSSHYNSSQSLIIKPTQYNWVRTEDLDKKLHGTDRPYRNTYGDKSHDPSKLFLSTELPSIEQQTSAATHKTAQNSTSYNKNRWVANRQIEKVYTLLHSDPSQANKVHIITRRDARGTGESLPIIIPHFYVQLSKSINQVMKEQQEADMMSEPLTNPRRPMTSEKMTYKPLPNQLLNPELIMSQKGELQIREKKHVMRRQHRSAETYNKMRLKPRLTRSSKPATGGDGRVTPAQNPLSDGRSTDSALIGQRAAFRHQHDSAIEKLPTSAKKRPMKSTTRLPITKSVVGAGNLQAADGFVFSVKITPKSPPNSKQNSFSDIS